MFKHLITILLLLSISVGYIAEASQGAADHCTQSSEQTSQDHAKDQCITSHCHFGHCATVKNNLVTKNIQTTTQNFDFISNLTPRDYVLNIFRPPISV